MQFAYVLHMCILHICSMHINSMYAISEFAYVRSLQLCHAYARLAYMQHYSSNICNIRFAHIYFCKGSTRDNVL